MQSTRYMFERGVTPLTSCVQSLFFSEVRTRQALLLRNFSSSGFRQKYEQLGHAKTQNQCNLSLRSHSSIYRSFPQLPIQTFKRWSSSAANSEASPLQVCVVGSGPAGFYTVDRLLKKLGQGVRISLLDRLPTPFGLVRSGVAPDHQDTKNVTRQFSLVGADPRVKFLGGVHVGTDVSLDELRKLYDVVVLACGCEGDRQLRIPGVADPVGATASPLSSAGVLSAREFVWWYNGHPDAAKLPVDLNKVESVAICGIGNVALDCARVLLRPAAVNPDLNPDLNPNLNPDLLPKLARTDIAEHALRQLRERDVRSFRKGAENAGQGQGQGQGQGEGPALKNLRNVHIVARRGPVQAACTVKELKELLMDCGVTNHLRAEDLALSAADEAEVAASRQKKRLVEVLSNAAKVAAQDADAEKGRKEEEKKNGEEETGSRNLYFHFYRSPAEVVRDEQGAIVALDTEVMALRPSAADPRQQEAVGTGVRERIPCQLILVSIGYKGVSIPGAPFDAGRGIVPNANGRVLAKASSAGPGSESGKAPYEKGLYVVGWLKRGPSGIVGTNMVDADDTVASILRDIKDGRVASAAGEINDEAAAAAAAAAAERLKVLLEEKNVQPVDWQAWQAIDRAEIARGVPLGKVREKFTDTGDMYRAIEEGH